MKNLLGSVKDSLLRRWLSPQSYGYHILRQSLAKANVRASITETLGTNFNFGDNATPCLRIDFQKGESLCFRYVPEDRQMHTDRKIPASFDVWSAQEKEILPNGFPHQLASSVNFDARYQGHLVDILARVGNMKSEPAVAQG